MIHLLLVEDDKSLGATLCERLEKEGYKVTWKDNFSDASAAVDVEKFELAVLDVGLPDGSGFDLAKEIRAKKDFPFIFMTAASDAENRLQGFELGAEEFVPKPFHLKELMMRVEHVIENHVDASIYRFSGVEFESAAQRLVFGSESVELTLKESQLLKLLIDRSPQVVSREDILNEVWGEDKFPSNRTVDNIIVKLRQLLREDGKNIRSVRGVGYQWSENHEV